MKRLLLGLVLLLLTVRAWAGTTYYVDAACPTAGNGTSSSCLSSPTTNNPKKTIADGIALVSTSDDILNIRGIHVAHGACPGSTTGNYQVDEIQVQGKNGTAGHNIILQNNGYTGAFDSGEQVLIEGVGDVAWTQCSWNGTTCDCGAAHSGIQIGAGGSSACTATWYYVGTGNSSKALSCAKADGTPCFRVGSIGHTTLDSASLALMTNATAGYLATVCSGHTWIKCNTAADCPVASDTCGGSTSEVDSVSDETTSGSILARWGSDTRGPVVFDNNGEAFWFCNSNYFTVRGLHFRNFRRTAVDIEDSGNGGCSGISDHITVTNNTFLYGHDNGGSDHHVSFHKATDATATGNYMAYSGSEAIHTHASHAGASAFIIQGNFIRDSGNPNVLGSRGGWSASGVLNGTPEAMTITDDNSTFGDYTGTDVSGNFILRMAKGAIIFENTCSNLKFHDNIIDTTGRAGLKFAGDVNGVNGNHVYNNLFRNTCTANLGDASIYIERSASTVANNLIYNNTVVNPANGCPALLHDAGSNVTGNLIRNNIFYTSGSAKMVNGTNTDATNLLEYNLIVTTANPAITWLNTNRACSAISSAGTGNINGCPDPLFVNSGSNDFHIQATSPAKDTGTATGMPAGRTRDINNTVASAHGLPSYADNQAQLGGVWDMGADEQGSGATPFLTLSKTDSPDPVLTGSNLTYTLNYANTGAGNVTSAVLTDTVPTNTTFVSATGGGTLNAGVVTWTIGNINAGTSGSVQLVVQVSASIAQGTTITNATYSLSSNELATVVGGAITTSTNPPSTEYIYPLTGRTNTWPKPQTFLSGIAVSGTSDTVDLGHDYTMANVGAPTVAQGATTGGLCSSANTYTFYVSEANKSGDTAAVTGSTTIVPSSTTSQIIVTHPFLDSQATQWDAWWSSDGGTTKKGCSIGGAENNSLPSTATFSCQCRTGSPSAPAANTTRRIGWLKVATDYISRSEIALKEVCATGCEFTTVISALAAITDATTTKRYIIYVRAPYEDGLTISAKSYVTIVGESSASVKIGTVQLEASVAEFGLSNLRVTSIHINGDGAGNNVYLNDIICGSASSRSITCFDDSFGNFVVHANNLQFYTSSYAVGIGITSRWIGSGNYYNTSCTTGNPCPCWWLSSTGSDNRDGGDLIDIGPVCEVSTSGASGDFSALRLNTSTAGSAAPVGTRAKLVSPTIRVTSTNATTTARVGCYLFGGAIANSNPSSGEIDGGTCEVAAAGSTATVFGLAINADADFSNWAAALRGGSISLSGGTSRTDVINADTVLVPVLSGVTHSGVYSGAGTVSAADERMGKFTTRLQGRVGDLVAATCTNNEIALDTGGANKEICICDGGTWACATVTTATGPTN